MDQPFPGENFDRGFEELSKLAYEEVGLVLGPGKVSMIRSRLRHRLEALSIPTLEGYCAYIRGPGAKTERAFMISALTTNVSGFFRESHHFENLVETAAPYLRDRLDAGFSVRIWSAGCSSGQEPYSIAMALMDFDPAFLSPACKILATDIDPEVIRLGHLGRYDAMQAADIPATQKQKYFFETGPKDGRIFSAKPGLKSKVKFRELNLIRSWPIRHKFDAIFCRNVMIYFDADTQKKLCARFHDALHPKGLLYVGHSERVQHPGFKSVGTTTYQKQASQQDFDGSGKTWS